MDFFNYKNIEQPKKGDLLISEPFLPDPNFDRTVVLLCEHNEEGSFGFVLNKPSILQLSEVLDEAENFECELYVGGPVQQNTLHFIHNVPELTAEAQQISSNLYWGGNFEVLKEMLKAGALDDQEIRFFVGYSGWSAEQLDEEIAQNSWIVARGVHSSHIFLTDPSELWKRVLHSMGGRFKVIANYPIDPNLN